MSEKKIRIEVTVEPRGSIHSLSEVVEIDASEVEGLPPDKREAALFKIAEEAANELAPWGWSELPGEEGEGNA